MLKTRICETPKQSGGSRGAETQNMKVRVFRLVTAAPYTSYSPTAAPELVARSALVPPLEIPKPDEGARPVPNPV